MELPTLDHPGWGRLLAVVAAEHGPRAPRPALEAVPVDADDEPDHERVEDTASAAPGIYA